MGDDVKASDASAADERSAWAVWAGAFNEEIQEELQGGGEREVVLEVPSQQSMALSAAGSAAADGTPRKTARAAAQHSLRSFALHNVSSGARSFPGSFGTADVERSGASVYKRPPPQRGALEAEEARADSANGSALLRQMREVVSDWADDGLNLTMYICFQVHRSKTARFEQFIEDIIVVQSQHFPGYRGTLMFRPDDTHSADTCAYVIDVRYSGAKNLWRWLQSPQRAAMVAKAQASEMWDSEATVTFIYEGLVSTIDDIWNDKHDDTDKAAQEAERQPELAKWRVILFNTLCVWISVLVLAWPYGSMSRVMQDQGWNLFLRQWWVVVLATVEVQWLLAPFFQPYCKWFLLRKRPSFWLLYREPLLTWYEGFWLCRPKPPASEAASTEGTGAKKPRDDGKRFLARFQRAAARAKANLARQHPSKVPEGGSDKSDSAPEEMNQADTMLGVARSMAEFSNLAQRVKEGEEGGIGRARTEDLLGEADEHMAAVLQSSQKRPASGAGISVVFNHHVDMELYDEYEETLRDYGQAAENFDCKGFLGCTLVRPKPGSNMFMMIMRFRDAASLEAWMTSGTRRQMAARLHKFTQSEAEVRVATHTALDLLLTGHGEAQAAEVARPPPAKFKVMMIVCVALYICSLPSAYWLTPYMGANGVPSVWGSLVTSTINTYLHGYTLTPLFSLWAKPWLDMDRPEVFTKYRWLKKFFAVRWVYDGFSPTELPGIMCLLVGLLIGFAVSSNIYDEWGPFFGEPAANGTVVACGMVFPYP